MFTFLEQNDCLFRASIVHSLPYCKEVFTLKFPSLFQRLPQLARPCPSDSDSLRNSPNFEIRLMYSQFTFALYLCLWIHIASSQLHLLCSCAHQRADREIGDAFKEARLCTEHPEGVSSRKRRISRSP